MEMIDDSFLLINYHIRINKKSRQSESSSLKLMAEQNAQNFISNQLKAGKVEDLNGNKNLLTGLQGSSIVPFGMFVANAGLKKMVINSFLTLAIKETAKHVLKEQLREPLRDKLLQEAVKVSPPIFLGMIRDRIITVIRTGTSLGFYFILGRGPLVTLIYPPSISSLLTVH